MNKLGDYLKKRKMLILCEFLVFVGFYILNVYTPLIADDHGYTFILNTNQKLASFTDVIVSQVRHYFGWGGRSVAHTIAQYSLLLGKPLFNVTNSIIYLLLINLICKHAIGKQKITVSLFIFVNLLVFIFTPVFGQVMLWLVGSSNYLWTMVIMLTFALPYRLYLDDQQTYIGSKWICVYLMVMGILAGWTNENTAGAIILLVIIFMILYKLKNIKLPMWCFVGLGSALLGFILLIAAPGNYIRLDYVVSDMGFFEKMIHRFNSLTGQLYSYLHIVILFLVVLMLIHRLVNHKKISEFFIPTIYVFVSIAAGYAMILSPFAPPRTFIGTMCLTYIAVSAIFYQVYPISKGIWKSLMTGALVIGVLGASYLYVGAYKDIKHTYDEDMSRREYILEEKEKGNLDIYIDPIYPQTRYNGMYGLDDTTIETQLRIYYQVNSIKTK